MKREPMSVDYEVLQMDKDNSYLKQTDQLG